ncbi:hypothetical protein AB406_0087 [Riemerella anatipestifer]|uniref:Uncharacterized protein n=1 Tax=Riemerella anatipestifer TaxID=34085 RepID=A0A1S7DPK1_RIEAN|nr:hypothetical protein AB406_0062 [Riemerella anatipestifer]AQY21052.1 hypothetical protein AB406_0087 [Riemerella anatipestifer]
MVIDQIRTVDRKRIAKQLGRISDKEIVKVKDVLKETFVN